MDFGSNLFEALREDPELVLAAVRTVAALLPNESTPAVLDRLGWPMSVLEVRTAIDATYANDAADNDEYVVPVEWIKVVDRSDAVWEKGFFANQNSACKLRNRFTLEGLSRRFNLGD